MEVDFTLEFTDHIWGYGYLLPRMRSMQLILLIAVLISAYQVSDILWNSEFTVIVRVLTFLISLIEDLAGLALFIAGFALIVGLIMGILYKINQKRSPGQLCKMVVSPAGVSVESSVRRVERKWAAVREVRSLKKFILIVALGNLAYMIPKRSFQSSTDAESFYTYALEQWTNAKQSLPQN